MLALGACDDKKADGAEVNKPASANPSKPADVDEPEAKAAPKKEGIATHCDEIEAQGTCTEVAFASGTYEALGEDGLKERCSRGTFGKGECPKDGRIGTCTSGPDAEIKSDYIVHYTTSATTKRKRTADEAAKECTNMMSGVFVPAAG